MIAHVVAVLAAALFIPAAAKATVVVRAENAAVGRHLTDGRGASLYIFEEDR